MLVHMSSERFDPRNWCTHTWNYTAKQAKSVLRSNANTWTHISQKPLARKQTLLQSEPWTVFSVCQPWASLHWLAARLLASGDVEAKPRTYHPQSKQTTSTTPIYTCSLSDRRITKNQGSMKCYNPTGPEHWVHTKCTNTQPRDHHSIWTCPKHTEIPQNP
jgi:hypothetical protein